MGKVAPYTGAWIETKNTIKSTSLNPRRPLHGGVD